MNPSAEVSQPLAVGPALVRAGSLVAEIYERRAREVGLSSQQARLLFVLAEQPSNMLGLGAMVRLGKSTMTSLVDRMEELRLLTRSRDPTDRRRLVVKITELGAERSQQFESGMRDSIVELLGALNEVERGALARLLSVILGESDRVLRSE